MNPNEQITTKKVTKWNYLIISTLLLLIFSVISAQDFENLSPAMLSDSMASERDPDFSKPHESTKATQGYAYTSCGRG